MLLVLAFAAFFSGYNLYENYEKESLLNSKKDRVVSISEEESYTYASGYEVIHLILEEQKRADYEELSQYYSNTSSTADLYENSCEFWISGKTALKTDTAKLDTSALYIVSYEKDTSGNIIKAHYSLK